MDERSSGLILRLRPLTETSLIVHWLTPDLGRMATVAKGARRPKSPFRGKIDLYFFADFSFQRSRRSDLHILREVSLRETHSALRTDLIWVQQASYCSALIEQTTETDTPVPQVFELMTGFLKSLSQHPPQPLNIFAFETKLLHELGLKPDFAKAKLSEGSKQIFQKSLESDWPMLLRLKPSAAQADEISRFLEHFIFFHLGKVPKGRRAAALES